MTLNNLHWDWGNWWRIQRPYFRWTKDISCAVERGFHCRVPRGWLAPHPVLIPIIHVPDYLAVGPGSAPGVWAVILGMYETHLKYGLCLQPISFNNLGPWLTCVIGVVGMHILQVKIGVRWHNNNKLFIMYWNWLSLFDTCMYVGHLMLHLTWLDIWL